MAFWVLSGFRQNWTVALKQGGIWGVKERLKGLWLGLQKGDVVIFYATSPIKGIIGFGRIRDKFVQDKPLWPDEEEQRKVLYPYRFDFDVEYCLPSDRWEEDRISGRDLGLGRPDIGAGLNALANPLIQKRIQDAIANKFGRKLFEQSQIQLQQAISTEPEPSLDHSKLQELVFEIGRLNRFISEKEYNMERERLDVVWRRVEKSVPTYVFEVQVGGDIYHALGKLKHAFDLWNSNIFIVLSKSDAQKADALLSGTFHEIQPRVKKIFIEEVWELYQQKRKWQDLERKLGLL
jgi:predicted RNA-binding protein